MKFGLDKPVRIVMIGAGGTGGYTVPHLYRLLHTLDRPVEVILADGDMVEKKNLVRQNFIASDLGKNKAQALAERYAAAFGMEVQYLPEFIESSEKLSELLKHPCHPYSCQRSEWMSILIGAVDNNRSRQICHQVFLQSDDLIYIDSGNGEYTGQVVCGIRRDGRTYWKPVGEAYPDILENTDKLPTELSCAEASVSAPQSMAANIMAAAAIVAYVYNILVLGSIDAERVTFSARTLNLKSVMARIEKSGEGNSDET